MRAKVIHATIDPRRLEVAADAVRQELGPQFLAHPGARHGYWMADRSTGHLLAVTVWDNDEDLRSAAASDGAHRALVAEQIGMRILAVHSLDVVGAHEEGLSEQPHLRWVRATWVNDLRADVHGQLPGLYREAVPDQARVRGFCASYWLVDLATGSGLGLSLWQGPAELSGSELNSRRRRRRFEDLLGCRVSGVAEYEALGLAQRARPANPRVPVARRMSTASAAGRSAVSTAAGDRVAPGTTVAGELSRCDGLGTRIDRPPGALLAVRGDRSPQVVVLVDGRAAVVHGDEVLPVVQGAHFGAHATMQGRPMMRTILATSPVQLHVLSRTEFAAMNDYVPSVAHELITHDLDR